MPCYPFELSVTRFVEGTITLITKLPVRSNLRLEVTYRKVPFTLAKTIIGQ